MFKPFNKPVRKKPLKKDGTKKKVYKKRPCRFCGDKVKSIDYLEYQKFHRFITERGKIVPSRISGSCARHQRQLTKAIKKARELALLPFVAE